MAAARGFRVVAEDYGTLWPKLEDPALETPVDPGEITPDGGFYITGNPYWPAFVAIFTGGGQASSTHKRVLLVEYDDVDTLAEGRASRPWLEHGGDTGPGDPFSRLWRRISAGVIFDELTYSEVSTISRNDRRADLATVQAIMDDHGWAGWEAVRV